MARPPEMMILAEVSSGRSDFDSSSPTKDEMPGSGAAPTASTGAEPPAAAAGSGGAHGDHFLASFEARSDALPA